MRKNCFNLSCNVLLSLSLEFIFDILFYEPKENTRIYPETVVISISRHIKSKSEQRNVSEMHRVKRDGVPECQTPISCNLQL